MCLVLHDFLLRLNFPNRGGSSVLGYARDCGNGAVQSTVQSEGTAARSLEPIITVGIICNLLCRDFSWGLHARVIVLESICEVRVGDGSGRSSILLVSDAILACGRLAVIISCGFASLHQSKFQSKSSSGLSIACVSLPNS